MKYTCGVFLINKNKKLLVCHPTNHKLNFYSVPKGMAEENETFLTVAIREVFEETNIDLKILGFNFKIIPLPIVNYSHKKKSLVPFLFLEKDESTIIWDDIEIKCNSIVTDKDFFEMDDFKWVYLDEAKTLVHDTQKKTIQEIKKILHNG